MTQSELDLLKEFMNFVDNHLFHPYSSMLQETYANLYGNVQEMIDRQVPEPNWIKINSAADLPTEFKEYECWVGTHYITTRWLDMTDHKQGREAEIEYWLKTYSHYRPVYRPETKPPIQ